MKTKQPKTRTIVVLLLMPFIVCCCCLCDWTLLPHNIIYIQKYCSLFWLGFARLFLLVFILTSLIAVIVFFGWRMNVFVLFYSVKFQRKKYMNETKERMMWRRRARETEIFFMLQMDKRIFNVVIVVRFLPRLSFPSSYLFLSVYVDADGFIVLRMDCVLFEKQTNSEIK